MASKRLPAESSSDDSTEENEQVEDQSQETQLSLDATQTMYDSAEQDIYDLGPSVSNRSRSIELESDLPEEHENESEDEKNTNTVSAGELPMSQSEESEANQRRLKKPKKRSIKHRKVASETEKSSDAEDDVIEVTQGSYRPSKIIKIKAEQAELKKNIEELENKVMENKAKGKPPAKQNKSNRCKSIVWSKDAFHYKKIDCIVNKKIVVCGQCKNEFTKHSGTTNLILHMKSQHSEFWKKKLLM